MITGQIADRFPKATAPVSTCHAGQSRIGCARSVLASSVTFIATSKTKGPAVLYRLRPPADLTWTDLSSSALELVHKHGADLARLEWLPVEGREFSSDILRIALRHGTTDCSDGLVVDYQYLLDLGRSDEIRLLQHQGQELQQQIRTQSGETMEQLMPGWTEHGDDLDRRVAESSERTAREADRELAAVLAAPIKPELVEHWRALGGQLPR